MLTAPAASRALRAVAYRCSGLSPSVNRASLQSAALPACAAEAYQVATISSLLAGGYDGDATVGEMLRHGGFGLGCFNGVDGEMMVLDGRAYRGTTDGRAHLVARSERTPFAVVVNAPKFTSRFT